MGKLKPDTIEILRQKEAMRNIDVTLDFTPNANSSVLWRQGNTHVLACATVADKLPRWFPRNATKGWVNAEYSLLPGSTDSRFSRERRGAKGRTYEIERLIARSLRAGIDLEQLGPLSITVDCDILNADGGTRCASISAAMVALRQTVQRLIAEGRCLPIELRPNELEQKDRDWTPPVLTAKEQKEHEMRVMPYDVGAISIGLLGADIHLDLDYVLDSAADVDLNLIMTSDGKIVEVQATGEEATFTHEQLIAMLELGQKGMEEIHSIQSETLA